MLRTIIICFIVAMIVSFTTCQKRVQVSEVTKPLFDSIPTAVTINPIINEVSGIADSKKNEGYLWAIEDGGNATQLYLLNHTGAVAKKIYIKNITNRDWEDMAIAGTDLYVADIGDNNEIHSSYSIYKFAEPLAAVDTVRNFETYHFTYPDGPHDAEAFFVEPLSRDIYIITKRDNPSRIYKLAAPVSATAINSAVLVGQLTYSGAVGAAISADGKEVILKTYLNLGYYRRSENESILNVLQKPPTIIPYISEPQGEAVSFATANNGYFTLSEKGFGTDVKLYFYKRN